MLFEAHVGGLRAIHDVAKAECESHARVLAFLVSRVDDDEHGAVDGPAS
jgi:hypothetical protein